MDREIKVTPYLLDPVSKVAFRIGLRDSRPILYGKRKGMKEKEVPFTDSYYIRAEMLNAFISEEEYENY